MKRRYLRGPVTLRVLNTTFYLKVIHLFKPEVVLGQEHVQTSFVRICQPCSRGQKSSLLFCQNKKMPVEKDCLNLFGNSVIGFYENHFWR